MNDYTEVMIRTTIAFVVLFLISKLLGKKLISQMTYFDYITGISLGTLSATAAMDYSGEFGPYFLALVQWGIFSILLGVISLKSRKVRKFVEGEPTLMIQNGQVLEENMKKSQYNLDNLIVSLRKKNIFNISDVEFALLEPDGTLSVLPKSQHRPITPSDLNLDTGYEGLSTELIMDGKIVYANLAQVGLDETWLKEQLAAQNVNSIEEVVIAQLRPDGTVYIDQKTDQFPMYHDV